MARGPGRTGIEVVSAKEWPHPGRTHWVRLAKRFGGRPGTAALDFPPGHCYLRFPQEGPSHFDEKLVFTVIEWPPPFDVICPEPLTLSGLSTSIRMVPLAFTSLISQTIFTSALVPVETRIVCLHSFSLLKGCSANFSLVSQSLLVWVLVFGEAFWFMRASNFARCSGVSLANISAGIGI